MKKKPAGDESKATNDLRRRAEERLAARASPSRATSPGDFERVRHDLEVHQADLQILNEELRRSQQELELSRKRYFDLYDQAPIGYVTLSAEGLIQEANLTTATLLGVDRETLVKQPLTRFILKEDQDVCSLHCKALFETGAPQVCEFRMVRAGAEPFWVRVQATAARDADGSSVCRAVMSDVTERKREEFRLAQSMQRYRDLLENAGVGVLIVDRSGTYLMANSKAADGLGKTPEEVVGRSMFDLLPREVAAKYLESNRRLMEAGGRREYEDTFDLPTGRRTFMIIDQCLKDNHGEVFALQTSSRDITDRKRAEEAVREGERFAFATIDALSAHVCVLDETGVVLRVNRAWRQFAGANGLAVGRSGEGVNYFDVCKSVSGPDAEVAADFVAGIRAVLSGAQEEFSLEYPCHSPEEQRWFVGRVTRFAGDGPIRVVVAHENITDRKQAEEDIRFRNVLLSTQQEASIDGILIVDEESRIISHNRRFVEMWNIPPELIAGKDDEPVLKFVTDQIADSKSFHERVQHLYEHRRESSRDEITMKDGRVFDRFSAPMWGEGDRYYGRVWYFRDITDRRRAEEALRDSERQFRELFNNMSSGVAVYVAKNDGEDFIFKDVNRAGERISEIVRERVLNRSLIEVFPGVKEMGLLAVLQEVWRTGVPQHHPVSLYKDERIQQWMENHVYKLPSGEIVTVYDDITERKQAEEQMRQQMSELRRWHDVTLGREERIAELKREVNELLESAGEKKRYGAGE